MSNNPGELGDAASGSANAKGSAFDVVAGLEAKLDELKDYLQRVNDKIQKVSTPTPLPTLSTGPQAHGSSTNRSAVHLQTLQMMKFDGGPRMFGPFVDLIDACVLSRTDLTDIEKLAYVISQLEGRPKDSVIGFEMKGRNLQPVLDTLKEKFGTNDLRKKKLQADLLHMPRSKGDLKDIRRTFDQIEQILREMNTLGEDRALASC
uniref:Uncharacterized protein n=1 Tax=Acrobeloides nanus TaxID=290746 RepID=A0A914DAY1_9BILA